MVTKWQLHVSIGRYLGLMSSSSLILCACIYIYCVLVVGTLVFKPTLHGDVLITSSDDRSIRVYLWGADTSTIGHERDENFFTEDENLSGPQEHLRLGCILRSNYNHLMITYAGSFCTKIL